MEMNNVNSIFLQNLTCLDDFLNDLFQFKENSISRLKECFEQAWEEKRTVCGFDEIKIKLSDRIKYEERNKSERDRYIQKELSSIIKALSGKGFNVDALKSFLDSWKDNQSIEGLEELFDGESRQDLIKMMELEPYLYKRLLRVFSEIRNRNMIRLGEFCASREKGLIGTVVLFKKAIENFSGDMSYNPFSIAVAVLLHELFHAWHYQLFKQQNKEDRWFDAYESKERDIVQESLAKCFEVSLVEYYQEKYNWLSDCPDYSKNEKKLFEELDVDRWPYSGALVLLDDGFSGDGTVLPYSLVYLYNDSFFKCLIKSMSEWTEPARMIKTHYYLHLISDTEYYGLRKIKKYEYYRSMRSKKY